MIDFACKRFELNEVIKCGLALTKSEMKIMYFLIKNRDRFTSLSLSKNLELDLSTVQRALKKLNEKNLVIRSQKNLSNGGYLYSYEIRDKKEIRKILMSVIHNWVKKVEDELGRW
jgi:predicted transcriptional regulator